MEGSFSIMRDPILGKFTLYPDIKRDIHIEYHKPRKFVTPPSPTSPPSFPTTTSLVSPSPTEPIDPTLCRLFIMAPDLSRSLFHPSYNPFPYSFSSELSAPLPQPHSPGVPALLILFDKTHMNVRP